MTSDLAGRMAVHFGRRRGGRPRSLHRMRSLARLLDHPQDTYRCLHVTGTNGKTTVTRLAGTALAAQGLRVGTFTSPHLHDVRERVAMDGTPVSESAFLAALDRVEPSVAVIERQFGERVTFFELMTATASVLFAEAGVDVAVIEAGIGGRLDPTNVHHGQVAVITSVGLDHPELGSTTAEVAREKAGILEPGRVAVIGPTDATAAGVIADRASRLGAPLRTYGGHMEALSIRDVADGQQLAFRIGGEHRALRIPFRGSHQAVNAVLAITAVDAFLGPEPSRDPTLALAALAAVQLPGHLERVPRDGRADVILDVAHNHDAARALMRAVAAVRPRVPLALVLAAGRGRDVRDVARPLLPLARGAYLVEFDAPSDRPSDRLRDTVPAPLVSVGSLAEALQRAEQTVGASGVVLVTGSHRLVAAARQTILRAPTASAPPQHRVLTSQRHVLAAASVATTAEARVREVPADRAQRGRREKGPSTQVAVRSREATGTPADAGARADRGPASDLVRPPTTR